MTDEHMTQGVLLLTMGALIGCVLYLGLYTEVQKSTQAAGRAYTMEVCSQAHRVSGGKSEQVCGDAQDQYKLEFLCDGTSVDSGCWTEAK